MVGLVVEKPREFSDPDVMFVRSGCCSCSCVRIAWHFLRSECTWLVAISLQSAIEATAWSVLSRTVGYFTYFLRVRSLRPCSPPSLSISQMDVVPVHLSCAREGSDCRRVLQFDKRGPRRREPDAAAQLPVTKPNFFSGAF